MWRAVTSSQQVILAHNRTSISILLCLSKAVYPTSFILRKCIVWNHLEFRSSSIWLHLRIHVVCDYQQFSPISGRHEYHCQIRCCVVCTFSIIWRKCEWYVTLSSVHYNTNAHLWLQITIPITVLNPLHPGVISRERGMSYIIICNAHDSYL